MQQPTTPQSDALDFNSGQSAPTHPYKKQVDGRSYAVYRDPEPDLAELDAKVFLHKDMQVDLREEYGTHLRYMSHLDHFQELRLGWDQTFFKSLIMPHVRQ